MDKVIVARNCVLRSRFGGYGRRVEDSTLCETIYIRKNTVFTVVSINLWTNSVLAVNQANKETISLEYDYILENCEVIDVSKSTVIDGIAIIDTTKDKKPLDWAKIAAIASILTVVESIMIAMAMYCC